MYKPPTANATPKHTHILSQIQPQVSTLYLLNCRSTPQRLRWRRVEGGQDGARQQAEKPFTQTLNKVPQESFQLPAEEEWE